MEQHFQTEQWVPFPLEHVFLFFANPQNLPRIMPPSMDIRIECARLMSPPPPPQTMDHGEVSNLAGVGSEIITSFRLVPLLPFRAAWTAVIVEFAWYHYFADIQHKGLFKNFRHKHELIGQQREGRAGTIVRDSVDYDLGFGVLGKLAQRVFVNRQMREMFSHRQSVLEEILGNEP